MSIKYLLDTNILSEPLRPRPNPKLLARLRRHHDELALSSIAWHELWFGCVRLPASARRSAIETYLDRVIAPTMPILPYDKRAAVWHAAERARLAARGKIPPFADGQIAAIAHVNDLILVTLNDSDFAAFPGLAVQNWSR